MKSMRGLLIIIAVLTVAIIGLQSYISSVNGKTELSEEQKQTTEQFDNSEDNQPYMNVTNKELLYETMPSIATNVINQVYAKNYEKDGLIDRVATIEGNVVKAENSYKFTIHFPESGVKREVNITIQNEATDNYEITVGDKL